jgi:hypothetical protein
LYCTVIGSEEAFFINFSADTILFLCLIRHGRSGAWEVNVPRRGSELIGQMSRPANQFGGFRHLPILLKNEPLDEY